jgi:hypothetical protein
MCLLIAALLGRLITRLVKVVQITFQKGNFHCATGLPFSEPIEIIPKANYPGK